MIVSQVQLQEETQKGIGRRSLLYSGVPERGHHMPHRVTGEAMGFGPVAEDRRERRGQASMFSGVSKGKARQGRWTVWDWLEVMLPQALNYSGGPWLPDIWSWKG